MIKVRASQIFSHSMEDVVDAKKQLDAGMSFLDAVEKFSTCPSKKNGGDLGWMPDGSVHALLGETLSERDVGKIIGPVHSPYGYHLLRISEVELEKVEGPFTVQTSMQELNQLFPEAHSLLFKKFHVGLPVSGYKPGETIGSVCREQNKLELEVLNFLNSEYLDKNVEIISPQDLEERMRPGAPKPVLLDIRENWERDIAIIQGSQLVTRENSESIISSLDKDEEIVLIDWKQDRSPSFRKWLVQRGFTQVKCLKGGIDAWAEKVETRLNRYDIDEDDGYRYEDIIGDPSTQPDPG